VVAALQDAESGASGDSAEHSVRRSS